MSSRFLPCLLIAATALILFFPAQLSAFGPRRYHDGDTERGLASWYGAEQGHQTASGERFDPSLLTAAHRHLPFGTLVRVTNRLNDLSVELRINDRGPFGDGDRIIDVSSAAADILQMKRAGVVPVEIEVVELGSPGRSNNR